jgi:NADH-quinone oxidoreductase subunit L
MTSALWLLPAFPLVGALVLMVFGRRLGEPRSGWFAAAMPIASFLVTVACISICSRVVPKNDTK